MSTAQERQIAALRAQIRGLHPDAMRLLLAIVLVPLSIFALVVAALVVSGELPPALLLLFPIGGFLGFALVAFVGLPLPAAFKSQRLRRVRRALSALPRDQVSDLARGLRAVGTAARKGAVGAAAPAADARDGRRRSPRRGRWVSAFGLAGDVPPGGHQEADRQAWNGGGRKSGHRNYPGA